jgi:hypothetical protein
LVQGTRNRTGSRGFLYSFVYVRFVTRLTAEKSELGERVAELHFQRGSFPPARQRREKSRCLSGNSSLLKNETSAKTRLGLAA